MFECLFLKAKMLAWEWNWGFFTLISLLNFLVFLSFLMTSALFMWGNLKTVSWRRKEGEAQSIPGETHCLQACRDVTAWGWLQVLEGGWPSWQMLCKGVVSGCAWATADYPVIPSWPQCCLCKHLGGAPASSISNMLSLAPPPQGTLSPTSTGLGQPYALGNS